MLKAQFFTIQNISQIKSINNWLEQQIDNKKEYEIAVSIKKKGE